MLQLHACTEQNMVKISLELILEDLARTEAHRCERKLLCCVVPDIAVAKNRQQRTGSKTSSRARLDCLHGKLYRALASSNGYDCHTR